MTKRKISILFAVGCLNCVDSNSTNLYTEVNFINLNYRLLFMRVLFLNFSIFLALLFVPVSGYADGNFGELSTIATNLGFKQADQKKLLAGKIITADLPETTDNMLAQSFAIYAPMYTYKIADLVLSARIFEADTNVIASGRINPRKIDASLAKAKFTSADIAELKQLKNFTGGNTFNLSTKEIAKLRASRQTSTKGLSKVYRDILAARMKAYLKSGINGVADYDRGEGVKASVKNDLVAMTKASTQLAKDAPGVYRSFLEYPKNQSLHIEHGFFWVKRKVQNRPTFVLEHRILERSPASLIILRREFFVGHSYNAAQAVSGAFTVSNKGTLVFSTIRSSSDQVAGFMSSTRHAVGRKMMRDEIVTRFKNLRKRFAK